MKFPSFQLSAFACKHQYEYELHHEKIIKIGFRAAKAYISKSILQTYIRFSPTWSHTYNWQAEGSPPLSIDVIII